MLFAAAGGTILAGVSYAVARQAQTKRRQAIQVENAASCTPQQLLSQHKHANYNKTFHRYVALEGIINTNTPVTFNVAPSENIYSSTSESKRKQTPSIDVDAVYFSRQLSDQLYRCKFETKKITRSTTNQSPNGSTTTTTSNNQRNQRNQMNNATADRPKGKVECHEYWSTSDPQHKMALTSIYLEHFPNGAAAVAVTNNKTSTNNSSSTKESKIAIQGVNISDFSESSRVIKNQFVSSHVDPAVITSQKNQHKLIVLSAAGSNIVLNELTPVKLGTREVVKGVTCGDTMVSKYKKRESRRKCSCNYHCALY